MRPELQIETNRDEAKGPRGSTMSELAREERFDDETQPRGIHIIAIVTPRIRSVVEISPLPAVRK